MKKWLVPVAFILFFLDISLKRYVLVHASEILDHSLHIYFQIFSNISFELAYVENTGVAWGMLSSFQTMILVLRIVVILALVIGLIQSKSMQKKLFPFLLVILGALGNVIDTFIYGYVIDMLHFTFWGQSYGVFNIADAMIFLGATMIFFTKESPHVIKQ